MCKVIRRTVSIVIVETWTIVWGDVPEPVKSASDAEEDGVVVPAQLPEPLPAAETCPEITGPTEEPTASPASGGAEKSEVADEGKLGGEAVLSSDQDVSLSSVQLHYSEGFACESDDLFVDLMI